MYEFEWTTQGRATYLQQKTSLNTHMLSLYHSIRY